MNYHILVVEDQIDIRNVVSKYLKNEGYIPFEAKNGIDALDVFSSNVIHLVLLDVMMPGIDGFEVLKQIRQISDVPIIMLTARIEEIDRLKGFDMGADDYVLKPFSVKELMKRVNAVMKRIYHGSSEIIYQYGDLSLHTGSMKLYKGTGEIPITASEFNLLHVLFKNQGQVLSREQLISLADGYEYEGFDRNIDSSIKRLRQKIESDPKKPQILLTKYGAGYVLGVGKIDD